MKVIITENSKKLIPDEGMVIVKDDYTDTGIFIVELHMPLSVDHSKYYEIPREVMEQWRREHEVLEPN